MSKDKTNPTVTIVDTKVVANTVLYTNETSPGEYELVALDKKTGEEKGQSFIVPHRTYMRTYHKLTQGDKPQFKVKKNPNQ